MKLICGDYTLIFKDGGLEVQKTGRTIYFNKRPMFVTIKTAMAINEFYNKAYSEVNIFGNSIIAKGILTAPSGSEFSFSDVYEAGDSGFKVSRNVKVLKAGDDLGFSTKISFTMAESNDTHDYNCFAPGVWYRQNQFAPDFAFGKDLDCEYFWQMETRYALPLFAMQNIASGETAAISRWASDVTMRSLDIMQSENNLDAKFTIGSIGMSRPQNKTMNYMYYGFEVRKEIETRTDGLSIDYVYPGCDGQMPGVNHYGGLDYNGRVKTFQRINHPVEPGFEQNYSVAVNFGNYDSYQLMMRDIWRVTYDRLRDKLFDVDNELFFHNCMNILDRYTRQYGDSYGLPFACQLPHMDINCVSFQFGFVGQQPGIGYQLLRYGDKENIPETFEKGVNIIDFWVRTAMTESGLPNMCYNPGISTFEPYPHYIRMLADGIEAILDAYIYMKKKGDERPKWREFCQKTADWLISNQNEDGSFYRAYNTDGSVRMKSKSNTPSVIRFLVQFYLVTGDERYKNAAIKAGDWSYENAYLNMEYRGGTCDNTDIQDKEAGIYAMFGFLALYDLTEEKKWLEGAVGAADYTETWTYAWKFPVRAPMEKHPFNRYSISGQSIITIGGAADVYMAACSYTYYRLYVITGDEHYLDFAEFIHKNTRQSSDIDGSIGYIMPGLGHESGDFTRQTLQSQYHWLPWCTFVEVDPSSRLYDTFGGYEIADAQKLSSEERIRKNRIYANYVDSL
ncbi:hypothetical protein [Ruminiclostridium cellulolyticum]|uniref:Uncharacterized protein n=1 Tax=Ruminiclostridium cellulolyticum (strain ATCC 35319 / DSM 5812 / JCM 6584 / H10) TaxID=394503 RepID=B8I0P2_RUMCH|nr:hypothetical protein [Ruminiclostridium cellulolyticum]ACL75617.1 hypothetical protein Ccel_1261 [Ruminiclostridium cellulolyticum H10]